MSLQRVYNPEVVTVSPETDLVEVARLLRAKHIGSVVVVEDRRPIGIITDRDIVTKVVAEEKAPRAVQAVDLMTTVPTSININYDPLDVTRLMREHGVRRLPVVDENRHLLGIVTLDDMLALIGGEIANLAQAIQTEVRQEAAPPPPPRYAGDE